MRYLKRQAFPDALSNVTHCSGTEHSLFKSADPDIWPGGGDGGEGARQVGVLRIVLRGNEIVGSGETRGREKGELGRTIQIGKHLYFS